MKIHLPLSREQFYSIPDVLPESDDFRVELFRYPAGIEVVRIHNRRGSVTVLSFFGQMIWGVQFDSHS